jgi:ABC-2 type transport system permease protein
MAMFWTVAYPIAMLAFLVMVFDTNTAVSDFTESYRFQTTVGLVSLTIASTALFGMGQAISDMRTHRALIPYMFLPNSIFGVMWAILASRIIVIFCFSIIFIVGSFAILGIGAPLLPIILVQVVVAILVTSLFCFAIVLPLVALSKNATTIIALANILNIYALISSSVFVPVQVLPEWAVGFVTTSPFYYLNTGLQKAFSVGHGLEFWGVQALLALIGCGVAYVSSTRRIMVPA